MSWDIFKQNILKNSVNSMQSTEIFCDIFAAEYDAAIRRGRDAMYGISILSSNKLIIKQRLNVLLKSALLLNNKFSLLDEIGDIILMYWDSVVMDITPLPTIPVTGSISNISVSSNVITSVGVWNPVNLKIPNNDRRLFLDIFTVVATLHLNSLSGIIHTISLYPSPSSPTPISAPGTLLWMGYVV